MPSENDPMPTSDPRPGYRWARNEFGWCQEREPRKKTQTPHSKLKSEARAALSLWKKRTGISAYYLPYFVGSVTIERRKFPVGKKGAADSFIAVLGTVLAAEAKAGGDRLSDAQAEFRRRWEKTGCPFVEYRSAQELVDALDRILYRGKPNVL